MSDFFSFFFFFFLYIVFVVFFFKQKTAYEIYQCDWSSDVCSSDLRIKAERKKPQPPLEKGEQSQDPSPFIRRGRVRDGLCHAELVEV